MCVRMQQASAQVSKQASRSQGQEEANGVLFVCVCVSVCEFVFLFAI